VTGQLHAPRDLTLGKSPLLRLIWTQTVVGAIAKKITVAPACNETRVCQHSSALSASHNCALNSIAASFRTAQGAYYLEPIKHLMIAGLNSARRTDLCTPALYNSDYRLYISFVTSTYMLQVVIRLQ
jgi:hypothetical protein